MIIDDWLSAKLRISKKETWVLIVFAFSIAILVFFWIARIIYLMNTTDSSDALDDLHFNMMIELSGAFVGFIVLEVVMRNARESSGNLARGLPYQRFVDKTNKENNQIRILTTFAYLFTPNDDDVDHKLMNKFYENVKKSLQDEQSTVQLLFLDPFSHAAYQRIGAAGTSEAVRQSIKDNLIQVYSQIDDMKRANPKFGSRIEARVFDDLPPFALFQTDNWRMMFYFEYGVGLKDSLRFDSYSGTQLSTFIDMTFDRMWGEKITRSIDAYMRVEIILHPRTNENEKLSAYFVKDERKFLTGNFERDKTFYLLFDENIDRSIISRLDREDTVLTIVWRSNPCQASYSERKKFYPNHTEFDTDELKRWRREKYGSDLHFKLLSQFQTIYRVTIRDEKQITYS